MPVPPQRTVFCDAECLYEGKHSAEYCAGPWYCSTTKVCETYHHQSSLYTGKSHIDAKKRRCAQLYSCAHYSQCFPSEEEAASRNLLPNVTLKKDESHFEYKAGGFTVKTKCCTNKRNYQNDNDFPCNQSPNSDSARQPRASVAAASATLLLAWWQWH